MKLLFDSSSIINLCAKEKIARATERREGWTIELELQQDKAIINDSKPEKKVFQVAMLDRMMRMIELICQGLKPKDIILEVVRQTQCSTATAWRTWRTRAEWLPIMVKAPSEVAEYTAAMLRDLIEARRLAFNLYYTAEGGGARAKALMVVIEACMRELEMRQLLGQIAIIPQQIQIEKKTMEVRYTLRDVIDDFGAVILKHKIREELAGHTDESDPGESLDPGSPDV